MFLWIRRWRLRRKYLRYRREAARYRCGTGLLYVLRPDLKRLWDEITAEAERFNAKAAPGKEPR